MTVDCKSIRQKRIPNANDRSERMVTNHTKPRCRFDNSKEEMKRRCLVWLECLFLNTHIKTDCPCGTERKDQQNFSYALFLSKKECTSLLQSLLWL